MTRQEIIKTWAALRRYYPNSTRSGEETMLAYLSALEPYPAAAVNAACKAYVQGGGRYWPDVADIVERLPREAAANDQDRAMRRCTPGDILGNIRAFAVVCELDMPRGMTVREAQEWRRAQPFTPWSEAEAETEMDEFEADYLRRSDEITNHRRKNQCASSL